MSIETNFTLFTSQTSKILFKNVKKSLTRKIQLNFLLLIVYHNKKMIFKNIFVTVGTTQFNDLINTLATPEIFKTLKNLGCENLTLQIGNGEEVNFLLPELKGIKIELYRLKLTIIEDIKSADLVISHAGAGSIIETLNANKPLVVVVNEELMNNHQTELAEQLFEDGYLFYCKPKNLNETLQKFDVTKLKKYEKGNVKEFVGFLDEFMGF